MIEYHLRLAIVKFVHLLLIELTILKYSKLLLIINYFYFFTSIVVISEQ